MAESLKITPKKHSKVVETENYMVVMGNLYQKEDLSCISQKGCIFNSKECGDNILNLSHYMMLSGTLANPSYNHNDFGIVSDPYIRNRYYYIIDNRMTNANTDLATANTRNYLVIANEEGDGEIVVVAIASIANFIFENIIDIDNNYLYVVARYCNGGGNGQSGMQIFKINKSNGTNTKTILDVRNTERGNVNLIYKDETYFYCIYPYYDGDDYCSGDRGNLKLLRFNKSNDEVKINSYTFPGYDQGQAYHCTDIQDFYKIGTKYYGCYNYKPNDGQNHLLTVCFDSSKNFDDKNQVLTMNYGNGLASINDLKWINDTTDWTVSFNITYRSWIHNGYMYLAVYDEQNTNATMINYQGLHIFKINSGFTLEYKEKIQFSNTKNIVSMCYNSDKSILLVGYYQSFDIYIYNSETHGYDDANEEITNVVCAGFDSMDRLWYQTLTGGVHCENLDDPQEVTVKFEKLLYTYEGTDILTYITFSAKSYTDKVPVGRYTFTLSDNAIFEDTHSNTLTIQYTGDDSVHYPVRIIGPKRITCSTVFEKVW